MLYNTNDMFIKTPKTMPNSIEYVKQAINVQKNGMMSAPTRRINANKTENKSMSCHLNACNRQM